jgi:hypothetical protein
MKLYLHHASPNCTMVAMTALPLHIEYEAEFTKAVVDLIPAASTRGPAAPLRWEPRRRLTGNKR